MISPCRLTYARLSAPARLSIRRAALLVAALLAVCLALGCGATSSQPAAPDYEATVQLLLPTAEPTESPTPTAATETPATDTPSPTYTPRALPTETARPTYTPRPAPTQPTAGQREPSIPFQATLLDGTELVLPDTVGSPTLLAFWAPW